MADKTLDDSREVRPPVSAFGGTFQSARQNPAIRPPRHPGSLGVLDQYELLEQIGEGGMGTVFKARDNASGKIVAVKILRVELAAVAQAQHRFAREARHMSQLRHLNILEVLAVGVQNDIPYFVMPLMERGSLATILRPDAPFESEQCLSIAASVAAALCYAHSKGITHRDLKPGNVLLDGVNTALLTDFGLARTLFNDSCTDLGQPHQEGTAAYMSPQLARGEVEDTRCDIYSFGALLYEMLTGRVPYEGTSNAEILERIRRGPPPPILDLRPDAPKLLVTVTEGAMAREHRDRYASMADVLADLKRIEKGQPPIGPHITFSLGRLLPDTYWRAAASGAVAILVLTALGYFTFHREDPVEPHQELFVTRSFPLPEADRWGAARLANDWNGDGEPDILSISGDTLTAISCGGHEYDPIALKSPRETKPQLGLVLDTTQDGIDEAFIAYARGTNVCLAILNWRGLVVKELTFPASVYVDGAGRTNYTQILPLSIADLDGDGRREILISATTSWARRPRGLWCFDFDTGRSNWFYETATFVTEVNLRDLDGDKKLEVIIGSNSPNNGCKLEDGTDDGHAYLYAISAYGTNLWCRELAGQFADVNVLKSKITDKALYVRVATGVDYEHPSDGTNLIQFRDRRESRLKLSDPDQPLSEPDEGRVLAFDAQGERRGAWYCGVQPLSAMLADFQRDGHPDVLVTDRTGVLHVLDNTLRETHAITVVTNATTYVDLHLVAVGHFGNADAENVILTGRQLAYYRRSPGRPTDPPDIAHALDNRVIVLNTKYSPVASYRFAQDSDRLWGYSASLLPGARGRNPELVVLTDQAQFLSLGKAR